MPTNKELEKQVRNLQERIDDFESGNIGDEEEIDDELDIDDDADADDIESRVEALEDEVFEE